MIPRDELEETFSPSPALRGRDLLFALAVILTLVAMAGAAVFFALYLTTPKTEATTTTSPSASSAASIATSTTAPTLMATPVAMRVCTDIPDGRLHVRFAAGDGSEVRGYLTEGETVLLASETETLQGEVWEQITSPIAGWVNARYLCSSE